MNWVIDKKLARSCRPGWPDKSVGRGEVDESITAWKEAGIRSVICLLDDSQLDYYAGIEGGLLGAYRDVGFDLIHIPTEDHKDPPLDIDEIQEIGRHYEEAQKPVLIHCSAGCSRTGLAVECISAGTLEGN